jgi:hypothetical protein
MDDIVFSDIVRQVEDRIRESEPEVWAGVSRDASREDEMTWRRGDRWATVIYHRTDPYKRLVLMLYSPDLEHHPEAVQVSAADLGVVDMIAAPVADLLKEATVRA